MKPVNRALAHRIVYAGKVYRLSIVDLSDGDVRITPFTGEVHSTPFFSGTIYVDVCGENLTMRHVAEIVDRI